MYFKVSKWPASALYRKNLSVIHFFPTFHFIHHMYLERGDSFRARTEHVFIQSFFSYLLSREA